MEPAERENVNRQLTQLIEDTKCSILFLATFQERGILSKEDMEALNVENRNRGTFGQSMKFYELIQTRVGSYAVLLEALTNTAQTGVLALLKTEASAPGAKTFKSISYVNPPKYILDFLRDSDTTLVIHTPDCEITRNRITETCQNVVEYTPQSFACSMPASSRENIVLINCQQGINYIKHCMKYTAKKVIVVSNELSDELYNVLTRTQCKGVRYKNDVLEWNDLHISMQISVEETLIFFQLPEECGDALPKVKGQILFDLINGKEPKLFKNTIPLLIKYYIPRRLVTRNVISKDMFQDAGNNLFLIKGIKRHQLTDIASGQETNTSSNLVANGVSATTNFVVLEDETHYERIVSMVRGERPIHVIEHKQDKFIWIKSSAGIYKIQDAVDKSQNTLEETDFINAILESSSSHKYPVCISDSPGMGKSVLLARIGHQLQMCAQNSWQIGFVVISELVKSTKKFAREVGLSEHVISSLANILCENELGVVYFQKHRNQLTNLLLDGLDELDSNDLNFGYELLQMLQVVLPNTRIWVTTRPHMFSNLEKTFNVLGYNIFEFEEKDQINFLKLYWSREGTKTDDELGKLENFAQNCLSSIKSQINSSKEHDIAGIPLQCLLIGEVFEDDALRFARTNAFSVCKLNINSVTDLYERLVKKKFDNFYERYDKDTCGYVDLTKEHTYYSMWLLFPRYRNKFEREFRSNPLSVQAVFNVGILESKTVVPSPRFIHRTFAEYFVAKFVVDALSNSLSNNLFNLLFKNILKTKPAPKLKLGKVKISSQQFEHNVICYFVDSLIGKNGRLNIKSEMSAIWSNLELEFWKKLCEGCAFSNFNNIFYFLVCDNPSFKAFEKKVFTEEFVVICTVSADANMVNKVCMEFKRLSPKNLTDISSQGYSLLEFAVIRGDYKIFEKYLDLFGRNNQLTGEFYWDLACTCVADSKLQSEHTVKEKIEILRYVLVKTVVPPDSLSDETNELLNAGNIHTDLVAELLKVTKVSEMQIIEFVHRVTSVYNCLEYRKLLQIILAEYKISITVLLNTQVNATFLLELIAKNLYPDPEFLLFLEESGLSFKLLDTTQFDRIVRNYGCSKHWLNWIFQNISKVERDGILTRLISNVKGSAISALIALIDYVSPTQIYKEGNTIFHKICQKTTKLSKRLELMQHLLDKRADVCVRNEHNETPLDILCKITTWKTGLQMWDCVLTSSGNNKGEIFYHKVKWITQGYDGLKFSNYADICSKVKRDQPRDYYGNTLVHVVAMINDFSTLEHLVSLGADVNAQNKNKETPLHKISKKGDSGLKGWKLLIDNGADPWLYDSNNCTPIHYLHRKGVCNDITEHSIYAMNRELQLKTSNLEEMFLLTISECIYDGAKKLCDWYTKNVRKPLNTVQGTFGGKNATVLDVVLNDRYRNVNKDTLEYIVEAHNCTNTLEPSDNDGNTLLHRVASVGNFSTLKHFVSLGADINARNNMNESPLHLISKNRAKTSGSWKFLIDNGADPCSRDSDNDTPIHNLHIDHFFKEFTEYVIYAMSRELQLNTFKLEEIFLLTLSTCHYGVTKKLCEWFTENTNRPLNTVQGIFGCGQATVLDVVLNDSYRSVNEDALEYVVKTHNCISTLEPRDKDGNTLLHRVASVGNFSTLNHFVSLGADINARNNINESPLHLNSKKSDKCLMSWKLLIDDGADPCSRDSNNYTPIHNLHRNPFCNDTTEHVIYVMTRELLNTSKPEEIFLLTLSACSYDVAKKLCVWYTETVGKPVNTIEGTFGVKKVTVLDVVLNDSYRSVNEDALEYVVKTHNCISTLEPSDKDGNTLIHRVTSLGNFSTLEHFLLLGADVNARNNRSESPLHVISKRLNSSLMSWKLLIDNGADPCSRDSNNYTPIHNLHSIRFCNDITEHFIYAMNRELLLNTSKLEEIFLLTLFVCNYAVTEKLCVWFTKNTNKPLNTVQGNFRCGQATVLDAVLHSGYGDSLEYILNTHNCRSRLQHLENIWLDDILSGHRDCKETVKFLELVNNLLPDLTDRINTPNQNGGFPLSNKHISPNIIRTLVELGANVNVIDKSGNTPLHWALKHNGEFRDDLVTTLIECGADVNAITDNGETPLSLSISPPSLSGHTLTYCFEKLINSGADVQRTDASNNTIVHLLSSNIIDYEDFHDLVEVLLEQGYKHLFSSVNANNETPLQIAQQKFKLEECTIQLLRKYGVSI